MAKITFSTFCQRIADAAETAIGWSGQDCYQVINAEYPNPRFRVSFFEFMEEDYLAEFFLGDKYHSSITYENGKVLHFENMVSPTDTYDQYGMPIGGSQQNTYYEGVQITSAVRSVFRGNAYFDHRKPLYSW